MNNQLNCKDWEIEVKPNSPFDNDALNRQRFASVLNSIIEIYSQTGIVLSINGEWGSGKTTFIRMWRQYLIDNGYRTLYFNAWKTDFFEDALTALLGELKNEFPSNEHFKNVIEKGSKISLSIGEAVLKGLLRRFTGIEADALSAGVSAIKDQFAESIETYAKRKTDLDDFRSSLSELVASESNGKPVIFFIDELDRCKPDYAVQVLERVKHLFEVPNIVFVVSVNELQLQYAIQGFYGSNNIDGKEYLRRFFDISFDLPTPKLSDYAKVLYQRHDFETYFSFPRSGYGYNSSNDRSSEVFLNFAGDVLAGSKMNLRLANKIFAYTRLVLHGYASNSEIPFDTLFLLCFLKVTNADLFSKIKIGAFSIQGLITELENQLPPGLFSIDTDMFTPRHSAWAIAGLISYYSYSDRGMEREPSFKGEPIEGDNRRLSFPVKTEKLNKDLFDEALTHILSSQRNYMYGLKGMIEKIELNDYINF